MDIIDKINILLAQNGKTGADMSREIGLSNSAYSQWNTGKTKPSKKTIAKIAAYFGVSVDYLLTGEQKKEPPAETGEGKTEEFSSLIHKLTDEEKRLILAQIRGILSERE